MFAHILQNNFHRGQHVLYFRKRAKGVVQTRIKVSLVKVNKQTRTEERTY